MESERMADIIQEMRMARTEFPFAYLIGRKDKPAEFDADGLMVKPRSIVIEKVTIETLADRIEKAWEREKANSGNAAAMREALLWVIDRMNAALIEGKMECEETIDKCKSALSKPPRNCDVGTAEEQVARHHAYCYHMMKQNNHCCGPCPCYEFVNGEAQSCTLLWAQMHNRAEEGAGK